MYGQSCRVVGRGGVGFLRFGGASLCWGAQRDHPHPPVRGDPRGLLGPLGEAIHRPTKALAAAADGEQRVQDLRSHVPQMWGSSGSSPLVYVSRPGLCGGGGVVGGEEGVGAVYHPVVSGCVVVGGGEDVVQIVHEGHVRGGGWLPLVGGGDVPREVVPEVAQGGHPGYPCFPLPLFGVVGGGAGWGVGHVGLAVAGWALGVVPLRHGVSD